MSKTNGFCDVCAIEIEVEMCCNQYDCGCMGQPINVPVCSQECYDVYMSKEYNEQKQKEKGNGYINPREGH